MGKIFITGSSDGLGQLAARALIAQGHEVVLHARDASRAKQAQEALPGAATALTGDLSNLEETIALAKQANQLGPFDAVIHNAGVYRATPKQIFYVNTLAPYILTCLVTKPKRLVYLSSGMHLHGKAHLNFFKSNVDRLTYSDSKLHVVMLALAVARRWKDVYANAVDPGWVPTKMGGAGAPDNLQKGYETQVWLAASNDANAKVSGRYFYHQRERAPNSEARDIATQDKLLELCGEITGAHLES